METIEIIYGILLLVQGFFLFWFGTMIKTQKSVVDSFKAQGEHLKNFQEMQLNLIKPETFQDIITYKEKEFELKYRDIIGALKDSNKVMAKELMETVRKYRSSYFNLVSIAAYYKLHNSDNFEMLAAVLQLKTSDLDEIEKLRKKIVEGSEKIKKEVIKAGGTIIENDNDH